MTETVWVAPSHDPKGGTCFVCGKPILDYQSKWIHEDGRIACSGHYLWACDEKPPPGFKYYTDG